MDQEEVARQFQKYDFTAMPVVDNENRLVGIITVDDVVDILQEEAHHRADNHHQHRDEVTRPYLCLDGSPRVDILQINIIHHVCRSRIHRRSERRHERRQQPCQQQTRQPHRHILRNQVRKNRFEIRVGGRHLLQPAIHFKEIDSQQRKSHNHQVTRNQQNDRHRATHQCRLLGRLARQNLLHVIVRSRPRHTHKDPFQQRHHHKDAHQAVRFVCHAFRQQPHPFAPVNVQRPAEERRFPPCRHKLPDHFGRHHVHADNGNDHARHRHDEKLHHIRPHNAEHTAQHHIECSNGRKEDAIEMRHILCRNIPRHILRHHLPRKENLHELTYSDKPVAQEAQHAEQGKDNDNGMRECRPPPLPETSLYPFGTCQHIAPAEPHRQIDHQKNLVEHGPQPRNPQAFEPVSKSPVHHQHGAGDVEHARRIGQPQHVKRQRLTTQEIRIHVLCRLLFQKQPDGDNNHQISTNNQNINDM